MTITKRPIPRTETLRGDVEFGNTAGWQAGKIKCGDDGLFFMNGKRQTTRVEDPETSSGIFFFVFITTNGSRVEDPESSSG